MTDEFEGYVWQCMELLVRAGRGEGGLKGASGPNLRSTPTTSSSSTTAQLPACMRVVFIYEPV